MKIPISFEFFPPNTAEGEAKLAQVTQELAALKPTHFSVTYGAGGSTRDKTVATVRRIHAQGLTVAPHLSCVGASRESLSEILTIYRDLGIRKLVALGGDLPSGMVAGGEFRYATDLIGFIQRAFPDQFELTVAAYPEVHPRAASARADLEVLRRKEALGARAAVTQFFYNADAYFAFVEAARALGITLPIIPGIMPIGNFAKVARFAEGCGAEIPRWLVKRMQDFGDDLEAVRAFGLDVVTRLCERLVSGGAPALHFYTMNQAGLSSQIIHRLRGNPA
ncbi:MAG: methylenetetrahydrofolate reductase [NAD(P)H] [Casimicrobiaceae bacterium]|nr:methylenetetrahydrofolate reductase [NAD(P)H] [Casimicrobiaceae bacterium]MCX8097444.1 methylenetetrahydrofolate reductase [NAD(P)H] [Casimicrobiaceae bacterium]